MDPTRRGGQGPLGNPSIYSGSGGVTDGTFSSSSTDFQTPHHRPHINNANGADHGRGLESASHSLYYSSTNGYPPKHSLGSTPVGVTTSSTFTSSGRPSTASGQPGSLEACRRRIAELEGELAAVSTRCAASTARASLLEGSITAAINSANAQKKNNAVLEKTNAALEAQLNELKVSLRGSSISSQIA